MIVGCGVGVLANVAVGGFVHVGVIKGESTSITGEEAAGAVEQAANPAAAIKEHANGSTLPLWSIPASLFALKLPRA